ncbi:MAG: cell division protein ZapA [Bacteroidales bacterium]|jgi:cell division protein ZapA (FtsZ GTPase activity inhibitor)|nr:cell division protein ZapA [Bacteroidales bacterium]
MEKQKISLVIAGRSYDFVIEPDKEEKLRLAVKRLNETIQDTLLRFKGVDVQDAMSIILFSKEVRIIELETKEEIKDILDQLEGLNDQLGNYLLSR